MSNDRESVQRAHEIIFLVHRPVTIARRLVLCVLSVLPSRCAFRFLCDPLEKHHCLCCVCV